MIYLTGHGEIETGNWVINPTQTNSLKSVYSLIKSMFNDQTSAGVYMMADCCFSSDCFG